MVLSWVSRLLGNEPLVWWLIGAAVWIVALLFIVRLVKAGADEDDAREQAWDEWTSQKAGR